MNGILNVRDISKRFGAREALSELSFDLHAESVTVLLGANGAGKSTLLRCLIGLCAPESGAIRVLDRDPLRDAGHVRRSIGYVPDQPDAYGWMNAADLFRFLRGQYPNWRDERVGHLVGRLQIPLDTRFDALSRGEAAKVMLVAALAHEPPLLLLDEPFARLAPLVRDEVLKVFLEEAPFPGGAALVATHDLEVAARIADRVLVLDHGRLVADVEIEDLCDSTAIERSLTESLRHLYAVDREEAVVR